MPTENRSSNTEMVSVPREHELKIRQTPLADLLSGLKTGEIRDCSDREFAVGDTVVLREIDDSRDYTGTVLRRTITHVQKNYGLPDHLCVLSYGQPAPQPHPEPIAWMVGTAIWWQKPGAERDAEERGEPMVPLGPCDSPSEVARLTAQFKEWQASHHRNYCKTANERDELRDQLEQARRLLHTASIRLANWLEPGDDPRKQIIAFLEDTADPTGTEEQPGFELIGPQLLEWNRSLVQPCILIGHEYGVATKAMKLARQALSGKSR